MRTQTKSPVGLVAALASVTVIVSGCGSISARTTHLSTTSQTSPTSASASPFPSSSPAPTTSAIPPSRSSSSSKPVPGPAKLARLALRTSDLPTGWTRHTYHDDPGDGGPGAGDSPCIGPDTSPDIVADLDSPEFWRRDATIDFDATQYRSQLDVNTDSASLLDPRNRHCDAKQVGDDVVSEGPSGSTLISSTSTVTRRSAGQPANVIATEASVVRVRTPSGPVTAYLESAYVRGPAIEVEVDFFNLGAPVPASLQSSVVAIMAARAARG